MVQPIVTDHFPSGSFMRCVAGARRKHDVCVPMCDSVTHFGRMLASHPSELDPLQVHGWALVSALCRLRRKAPLMQTMWWGWRVPLHRVVSARLHHPLAGALRGGFCCLTSLM